MSISTIAQIGSAVTNLVFVIVIAVGYYLMIRLYRQMVKVYDRMVHLMEQQSTTMGRPLVIVYEDPERLPEVNLVVENIGSGPAKDISFEFSSPIQSSDGFVLSDLNIFRKGMTSLAPGTRITCYWDNLENLLPHFETEEGATEQVEVTIRYKDLSGSPYETKWDINPTVYEGIRNLDPADMTDLVEVVKGLSETVSDPAKNRDDHGKRERSGGYLTNP